MIKRTITLSFALTAIFILSPVAALACACCAEPGTYFLSTYKPRTFELDLLKEVRFAREAKLYTTEAGFDTMRGLDEVAKDAEVEAHMTTFDEFDLASGFTGKQWRFEMRSTAGRKGVLTLPLPLKMTNFKVDIHDVEDRPNGPLLYKEYRFKGGVTAATGIFRPALAKGTSYTLVLQGRGVGCDDVQDYTHWRLDIDGPQASYAFYGKLASGEKPTAAK
ncbi:MAG: hypothetical protein IPM25_13995 [Chloracidobacterium sp.]|nr:hypothetical protein [Chloracidobacterium sp.]